jgi:hypothetical protein
MRPSSGSSARRVRLPVSATRASTSQAYTKGRSSRPPLGASPDARLKASPGGRPPPADRLGCRSLQPSGKTAPGRPSAGPTPVPKRDASISIPDAGEGLETRGILAANRPRSGQKVPGDRQISVVSARQLSLMLQGRPGRETVWLSPACPSRAIRSARSALDASGTLFVRVI